MERSLDGFPDWQVKISERSVGIYNLVATHRLGPSVDFTGTDPDELISRAKKAALDIEKEIAMRRSGNDHSKT